MCLNFNVVINPVEILTATWKAASRPCGYLRNPEPAITGMDGAMDKLRSLRMDIEERIRSDELAGQTPTHQVRDWLAKVSEVDAKVSKLKDGCKNVYDNWRINRRVRKRMVDIATLLEGGAFENVTDKVVPPAVQEINDAERPNNPSINLYLSQLRAYLQDDGDESRIIGIWGMGGVGKTNLLKCLNNELQSSIEFGQTLPEFDHVIWAVASKHYKLENLQLEVARCLGLRLHKDKVEQARAIFDFLKHRSFLLLLDDLWQPLDFTEVGFPHPLRTLTSGPKQKVVFTTRLEGVCGKIQARRILKIECLNKDEAWQLFQDKVGKETLQTHVMIPQLARRVAKECGGLPLALVVIGAAMSMKKTPMEWHNAITLLEKSRLQEIQDMEEDTIIPKLKFSYDNLDEIKQKCFLLCCLWQEDKPIQKTQLIECWMGHGLVDESKFDNIIEAYDNGHALIGNLLAACLLEPGMSPDYVKMHDVVRDLALWIVSNYGEKPNKLINNSNVSAFNDSHSEVERISLLNFDSVKYNSGLPSSCSKLETLNMISCRMDVSIFTGFFQRTLALTYLDFSQSNISELPSEISLLSNLRYLNLSYTEISSLPLQLGCLCELRFLVLRSMPRSIIIPEGLIEKLKVLSLIDMFHTMCENWKEILRQPGSLKGVGILLKTTEDLQLLIQHSNVPIWLLELSNLVGFKGSLHLGSLCNRSSIQMLHINFCESLKVVSIDNNHYNAVQNCHKGSFSRLDELSFDSLPKLEEIVFGRVVPAKMMPSLTNLNIFRCNELLNISWVMFLPSLQRLHVFKCEKIKQVIDENHEGEIGADGRVKSAGKIGDAFPHLKYIRLIDLPNLRLFSNGLLAFPSLETFYVDNCPEMKTLPFGLEIIGKGFKKIYGERWWWNKLEMEGDVRAALLPRFVGRGSPYPMVRITATTIDDGQTWMKFGQKEICDDKYPRSYFRCTHKYDQGCKASKQVQRLEEDPSLLVITYFGKHTCVDATNGGNVEQGTLPSLLPLKHESEEEALSNVSSADAP